MTWKWGKPDAMFFFWKVILASWPFIWHTWMSVPGLVVFIWFEMDLKWNEKKMKIRKKKFSEKLENENNINKKTGCL